MSVDGTFAGIGAYHRLEFLAQALRLEHEEVVLGAVAAAAAAGGETEPGRSQAHPGSDPKAGPVQLVAGELPGEAKTGPLAVVLWPLAVPEFAEKQAAKSLAMEQRAQGA